MGYDYGAVLIEAVRTLATIAQKAGQGGMLRPLEEIERQIAERATPGTPDVP